MPGGGGHEPPNGRPAPAAWSVWLSVLVSVAMLATIGLQIREMAPAASALLARLSPAVAANFGLIYLVQPVADLVIYRRLWGLPVSALGAMFRKTSINEAVIGYGGELYLYLWARRNNGAAYTPFAAVKDVNILSSMMGFGVTLAWLALAAAWADTPLLARLVQPFIWPAMGVVAVALCVLAFARRVFTLTRGDLAFVATVHGLRLAAICGLTLSLWSLALPEVSPDVWAVLLAITLLGARVPFVTNTGLLVANGVLLLLGTASSFALLLAGTAVATLAAHVVVIAVSGVYDLGQAMRLRGPSRLMPRG